MPPPGGPNNSKLAPLFSQASPSGECHNLGFADHRDGLEVESVESFAGRQPGFGEMAFEAAAAALGNLMFGQCCKEASGRPAFLVGLSGKRSPDQFYGGQPQLSEK